MNSSTSGLEALRLHPLIRYPDGSILATFRRRENRFLVEVETEQERFWVHCNNSGSMMGLLKPGAEVYISPASRPQRRLRFTLELVKVDGFWVGVNTLTPNRLLHLAWKESLLPEVVGYTDFRSESTIGHSRLDASLNGPRGPLWIEAKNVTLVEEEVAYFPDAVTLRGQKHLSELMALARLGQRVACFYLVQRKDAHCFGPADFIDPDFAGLFWRALREGVEMWPYLAVASPDGIGLGPRLPLQETIWS